MDAPSLEVSKGRLGGALSNLSWWKVSLAMAGELELEDSFLHKLFGDSMIL